MEAEVQALYDEAQLVAQYADESAIEASQLAQEQFRVVYAAERALAAASAKLATLDELRWTIAREIASYKRSEESLLDAVRRWYPDTWREALKREPKSNKLIANPMNAYLMLKFHPEVRGSIRLNKFTKQVEVLGGPLSKRKTAEIDSIIAAAQDWIYSKEDVWISFQDLGRRLVTVAEENAFDPLQDYLLGLKWDGVPRLSANGGWLSTYAGAFSDANGYVAEISKKFMVAAVSRALEPGSKTDIVLVLLGGQGLRKTSLYEVLGGPFYADAAITLGDKDSKMMASAAWILELPDMAGFKKSEQNTMKAFFTTRVDSYRAPFGRGILKYPRRCVFVTNTNEYEIFSDPTGNRRYLPVECRGIDGKIAIATLLHDRDQLWAEAVAIYLGSANCQRCTTSGDVAWGQLPRCPEHSWWLSPDAERVAAGEARKYEDVDVWAPAVLEWADNPLASDATGLARNVKRLEVTTTNCLVYGVGKPLGQCSHADKIRVGRILCANGWKSDKPHKGVRIYRRAPPDLPPSPPTLSLVPKV